MTNSGGTDYRVLVPTVAVLSVLFILTLGLVGIVVYKSILRRRRIRVIQGTHGTVDDDYSSAWSAEGLCHGPSVREGRLVRNASRHRMKESPATSTEEVIPQEEDSSNYGDLGLPDARRVEGRASPGIGRAMSYGSHQRHIIPPIMHMRDIDILPDDDKGKFIGSAEDIFRDPEAAHDQAQYHDVRHQSVSHSDGSGHATDDMQNASPHSATQASPSRSNSSFAYTPATPRGSVAMFPLAPPPAMPPLREPPRAARRASQRHSQGPTHPNRAAPQFSRPEYGDRSRAPTPVMTQTSSNNVTLASLAAQLSPKSGRPQMPRIEIPNTASITSRSLASLQRQASSPSDHGSTEEPAFSTELPRSATRANAEPSSPQDSTSTWSNQHSSSGNSGPPPVIKRPGYTRAPSSAVGDANLTQARRVSITPSEQSDISASPPKFATGPRVYSTLLPQLNPSASASRTSIVSVSSNASSNTTATGAAALGGLSPPPPRDSSPPATLRSSNEATTSNSVGARMTRTSILENAPPSPLNRQKSFPRARVPTVSEIKEAPETPKTLGPRTPTDELGREPRRSRRSFDRRRMSRSRSRHRRESGLAVPDDGNDDDDEYPVRRGSGYMFV